MISEAKISFEMYCQLVPTTSFRLWYSWKIYHLLHVCSSIFSMIWESIDYNFQHHARLETTWQTADVNNVKRTHTVEMEPLLVSAVLMENFQLLDQHQLMVVHMVCLYLSVYIVPIFWLRMNEDIKQHDQLAGKQWVNDR